jgi:toxin ParE1/3/4
MVKYYLTNKAVKDLTEIWNYTVDQWSEKQADKYYQMLLGNCQEIAKNPNLGKSYDGIASGLLGFRANRHIIFYRMIRDRLEIVRILHGSMDLRRRITE